MRKKSIISITTLGTTMDTFVLESMIYMQQHGWDVALMCNMSQNLLDKIPQGIQHVHVPMERSFSILKAIKCTKQLINEFRRLRPTIVQYGTTHAALFGSIAAWYTHVPIRIHLQWGIYNYKEMGFVGKFYWFVEWLTCKLSTHIRPVSHKNLMVAVEENLFNPVKGKVLGQGGTIGVDLKKYSLEKKDLYRNQIRQKYGVDNSSYVYGFIGRMGRDKGNNELFTAFRNIEKGNDVVLLLMGDDEGTMNKELVDWAKSCKKVVFAGYVSHEEIPYYLAAIDVLVHPTYREGFGMVLQEAMAMEVPIITTDIPGPSEVIEAGVSGILVPSHDADELEKAMMSFFSAPPKYNAYGKAGRKRVETCFERSLMVENIYVDKENLYTEYINHINKQ